MFRHGSFDAQGGGRRVEKKGSREYLLPEWKGFTCIGKVWTNE
jgi:hypothetical protein